MGSEPFLVCGALVIVLVVLYAALVAKNRGSVAIQEDMQKVWSTARPLSGDVYAKNPQRLGYLLDAVTKPPPGLGRTLVLAQIIDLLKGDSLQPDQRRLVQERMLELYPSLLNDKDPLVQETAVRVAEAVQNEQSVPLVFSALRNQSPWIVAEAARCLGRLGEQTAVPALSELLRSELMQVWYAAALSLHQLGWTPDDGINAEAAAAYWAATGDWERCALMGVPAIAPILCLYRDGETVTSREIAESLSHRPKLVEQEKPALVMALRSIGGPALDVLVAGLRVHKENWEQCREVSLWLISLGGSYIRRGSEDRVRSREEVQMMDHLIGKLRQTAHDLLLALHDPRATDGIIAAVGDSESQVRELAVSLATQMPDPRAVPALAANFDRIPVEMAVKALLAIGGPTAREALAANLGHGGRTAAAALMIMGDDRGLSWLLEDIRRNKNDESAKAIGQAYQAEQVSAAQRVQIEQHGFLAVTRKYDDGHVSRDDIGAESWVSHWKTEPTNLHRYLTDRWVLSD